MEKPINIPAHTYTFIWPPTLKYPLVRYAEGWAFMNLDGIINRCVKSVGGCDQCGLIGSHHELCPNKLETP